MPEAKNIKLYTAVRDYGQMVNEISFEIDSIPRKPVPEDFKLNGCFSDLSAKIPVEGVKEVAVKDGTVTIKTDWFLYRIDFEITGRGPFEGVVINKGNASETNVLHADWFTRHTQDGVNYRLYTPQRKCGARPLILFLHGGGGSGEDNELQLTDTLGAIKLAERCPDMYVMAPQAPTGGLTMQEAFARMQAKGDPYRVILGSDTDNEFDSRGWNRWYLAKVADIIRQMVDKGEVDKSRVYLIGMSMGGNGVLKMLSVAPELYAAGVAICPSMNGESWPILNELPNVPLLIASSYIDHSPSRHAYILRAVSKLWREGRKDLQYILFTEEELASYGIGTTPGLTTRELYLENHNSWILVLHNEYCILDWMFSHVKSL